jgi:hypothetical protein
VGHVPPACGSFGQPENPVKYPHFITGLRGLLPWYRDRVLPTDAGCARVGVPPALLALARRYPYPRRSSADAPENPSCLPVSPTNPIVPPVSRRPPTPSCHLPGDPVPFWRVGFPRAPPGAENERRNTRARCPHHIALFWIVLFSVESIVCACPAPSHQV